MAMPRGRPDVAPQILLVDPCLRPERRARQPVVDRNCASAGSFGSSIAVATALALSTTFWTSPTTEVMASVEFVVERGEGFCGPLRASG